MLAGELEPGTVVKVPKGTDPARPSTTYLLHIRDVHTFATGAVQVTGEVRRLDGTPTTLRFKTRTLTVRPEQLEASPVRPADLAPTPFGIRSMLRDAGFQRSTELPQRALRRRYREGFHVIEHPAEADTVLVRWAPGPDQAASPAETAVMLARYAEAIRAAGWHVTTARRDLTVTAAAAAANACAGEPDRQCRARAGQADGAQPATEIGVS